VHVEGFEEWNLNGKLKLKARTVSLALSFAFLRSRRLILGCDLARGGDEKEQNENETENLCMCII
jgi:hypothetical protein